MKDRKTWLLRPFALGMVVFGAGASPASADDLKPVEAAALERLTMHAGLEAGMWAHYIPRGIEGEFDSYDPIGLIAGSLIKTDCSISWQDESGRLYCFASGASLVHFRDWPRSNAQKARKAWDNLSQSRPQS